MLLLVLVETTVAGGAMSGFLRPMARLIYEIPRNRLRLSIAGLKSKGEGLDKLLFRYYTISMKETDQDLVREGWEIFTRIFMKYDILEKSPIDIGTSDRLNAAQVHTIEAIGKGYGKTVTALSGYFMITKGAVSQVVSRLHKMGYVAKTKKRGNDKEIILQLTDKGRVAFQLHEKYNEATIAELMRLLNKYNHSEIRAFLTVLNDIDGMLTGFVVEERKR